jgi:hypothetical protein
METLECDLEFWKVSSNVSLLSFSNNLDTMRRLHILLAVCANAHPPCVWMS